MVDRPLCELQDSVAFLVTFLGMFSTLPFALAPAYLSEDDRGRRPNQEEKGRTTTTTTA